MRVIFSGSRNWNDPAPVNAALDAVERRWRLEGGVGPITVVHGAARGLDTLAGQLAAQRPFMAVESVPANWDAYGKAAGHLRNQEMVDAGARMAFAFPIGESRGTRDFIRRATAAGVPVFVYSGGYFHRFSE